MMCGTPLNHVCAPDRTMYGAPLHPVQHSIAPCVRPHCTLCGAPLHCVRHLIALCGGVRPHRTLCGTPLHRVWHPIAPCDMPHHMSDVWHPIAPCVAPHCMMCGTPLRRVWHPIAPCVAAHPNMYSRSALFRSHIQDPTTVQRPRGDQIFPYLVSGLPNIAIELRSCTRYPGVGGI